jgi:hypothetical protein
MAQNHRRQLYHATMHVTRIEEWFVEADSPEEAQKLFEAGQGERAHLGELVQIEFGELRESQGAS